MEENKQRSDVVRFTRFPNETAPSKSEYEMTLPELAALIRKTNTKHKSSLPWIKLATFGDQPSKRNCLRYDANVQNITGIETDYDDGTMTIEDAAAILKQAHVRALLYTSASYTPEAPRWRVICPASESLPPERRVQLVARLNGLLGDVLAPESFVLSQSYYFGSVNSNPQHKVIVIDGDYIDTRDDLDAGAIGKQDKGQSKANGEDIDPNDPFHRLYQEQKTDESIDIDARLAQMRFKGKKDAAIHPTQLSVTSAMLGRGHSIDETVWRVLCATMGAAGKEGVKWDWRKEERVVRKMCTDWLAKHPEAATAAQNQKEEKQKSTLMQNSGEFVAGYVPPDYLIDGLMQRRYVYSFTGPTGSGKTAIILLIAFHVACGLSLAGREIEKGRVLFFAGENPDDVRTRWIRLCEEMGVEPDAVDVVFMPFTLDLSAKKIRQRVDDEAAKRGPFSLLIVDTSAAYYSGDDENDNKKLGDHARMLRSFVSLPGGPTILVTCHPTKTPNMENLLPRGGGAFLAEVDGNFACVYDKVTKVAEMTTHGKFRGVEFAPFNFKMVSGQSDKLIDSKGRKTWTVTARVITDDDLEDIEVKKHSDQNEVLRAMLDKPLLSLAELAKHLGWHRDDGEPNKQRVHRIILALLKLKLVEQRRDGKYVLTAKGKEEAKQTPANPLSVEA